MDWSLGSRKAVVIGVVVLGGAVAAGFLMGTDSPEGDSTCDLGADKILGPDQNAAARPHIASDWVVWDEGDRSEHSPTDSESDIYGYDLGSESIVQVTDDPDLQTVPEVYEDIVAWRDFPLVSDRDVQVRTHNLSNGTTWTLPIDVEGNKAPRGLWQDRLLVEGSDSLYLYNLSSRDLTQITDYDPGVTEIWGDRVVWVNTTGDKGNRTHRLMLYDVEQEGTSVVLESSLSLARPDIYQEDIVYMKAASQELGATWELYRYDLSSGIERPVASNDEVIANRDNPRIAGDWVVYGIGGGAESPEDLREGMGAYHLPSDESIHLVEAGGAVSGDIWQNKVVYVRFDECTDFKQQVALTTLPETP